MARRGLGDEGREVEVVVRTGDYVDTVAVDERLARPFGHTSNYAYQQTRSAPACVAYGGKLMQTVGDFLLGIVAYRARVEQDGVCLVKVFGKGVAGHVQYRGHYLAVGHIHLATVCFDKQTALCI